jgi:hypothetical protein
MIDLSGVTVQANPYGNAAARLWSIGPGTGLMSPPSNGTGGISIDENIQDSFTFNSVGYNLIDMRLVAGQHQIFRWMDISGQCGSMGPPFGVYTTAPLELYIFFKAGSQTIALVLPIGFNDAASTNASTYIKGLTTTPGTTPPPLVTLFQDLSGVTATSFNSTNMMLEYIGQDIRTYATTTCDPYSLNNPVTYLVIMNDLGDPTGSNPAATRLLSSTIRTSEYAALLQQFSPTPNMTLNYAPQPIDSSSLSKLRFIPGGTLYLTNPKGTGPSTVSTNSLKCYPVDPSKDVQGGQINLDENGQPIPFPGSTFPVGPPELPPAPGWSWTSAAGIETIISLAIAGLCIIVCIYGLSSWYFIDATGATITQGEALGTSIKTAVTVAIPTGIQSTASWVGAFFSNKVTLIIIGAIVGILVLTLAVLGIMYTVEHM